MAKFAIIETGGKQYKVELGKTVKVEKLEAEKGSSVSLDKVLLVVDGEKVEVGTPYVKGTAVNAEVLGNGRADKKIVFRYHSKTNYRKKNGHRQPFTEIKVTSL